MVAIAPHLPPVTIAPGAAALVSTIYDTSLKFFLFLSLSFIINNTILF